MGTPAPALTPPTGNGTTTVHNTLSDGLDHTAQTIKKLGSNTDRIAPPPKRNTPQLSVQNIERFSTQKILSRKIFDPKFFGSVDNSAPIIHISPGRTVTTHTPVENFRHTQTTCGKPVGNLWKTRAQKTGISPKKNR